MMGVPLMRPSCPPTRSARSSAVSAASRSPPGRRCGLADRFDFRISIIVLLMVVLGGMGNVWGVMVGAVVLAWINATGLQADRRAVRRVVRDQHQLPARTTSCIFGVILVLMMLFRREGLLPEARTTP